jgi:hypothetical protein
MMNQRRMKMSKAKGLTFELFSHEDGSWNARVMQGQATKALLLMNNRNIGTVRKMVTSFIDQIKAGTYVMTIVPRQSTLEELSPGKWTTSEPDELTSYHKVSELCKEEAQDEQPSL